ncbi:MAG: hypothetical protein ACUVWA_00700 [Candidatus Oleimicrobiaceae bacterium]
MRSWLIALLLVAVAPSLIRAQGPTAAWPDTTTRVMAPFLASKRDPLLGEDKVHHAMLSAFLAAAGYYLAKEEANYRKGPAVSFAACFSLSFGVGKELYDKRSQRGHASFADLVADVAGVALGLALFAGYF